MRISPMLRAARVGLCYTVAALFASAQDVSHTPLEWIGDPPGEAAQPPTFRSGPHVTYPDPLEQSYGYAIVTRHVDEKGKSHSLAITATNPYIEDAIRGDHRSALRPATNSGRAISSQVWYAVIFNPEGTQGVNDRGARLERVTPIFAPKTVELTGGRYLPARINLGSDGTVEGFSFADPEAEPFRPAVEAGLKHWRFAPALKSGATTASTIEMPVVILPRPRPQPSQKMEPPRVVHQTRPVYPVSMRRSGLRGEVLVGFVVDASGSVGDIRIVRSNNPGFDESAIEAVKQWRFKPARADGKFVKAAMQVPLFFELEGGGREFLEIGDSKNRDRSRLPEDYHYDVAPKPKNAVVPVYPYALLQTRTKGKATVVYAVNEDGVVFDLKVQEATHPDFGHALAASVNAYEFTPALKKGQACKAFMSTVYEFDPDRMSIVLAEDDLDALALEKKHPERIVGGKELDAPLRPVSRRAPTYPCTLFGKIDAGKAVVEGVVDPTGKVRLARIMEATHPEFGYSAVQSFKDWTFEPPKSKGRAAYTRVRVPFAFDQTPK